MAPRKRSLRVVAAPGPLRGPVGRRVADLAAAVVADLLDRTSSQFGKTLPSASSGHSETNILGLVAIKLRPVRDEHAPFDFEYDACVETRESRPGTRGARDKAQSESGQTLKMGRAEGRIAPNYQTVILEQPRGNRQSALHRLRARRAVVGDLGRRVLVRRARRRHDARRLEGRRRLPR